MVELDDTLSETADRSETASSATIPAASLVVAGTDFAELTDVPRDNYEIGAEIARGGMGRIIAARDRRAGRPIVIKEVRADLLMLMDDDAREVLVRRFKREAMLTARLQHPAVVPVYEIGRFGDTPFIAMKRVEGTPLLQLLDEADSLGDRLALLPSLIAVAEAIAFAHSESVIHRDLKPANILVGSFGETVVIDWGLAKLVGEGDEAFDSMPPVPGDVETIAGSVFGTPSYMPPEQADGLDVGFAADVYALGAILYHLLAGEAPYVAVKSDSSSLQLIELVREGPPPPIPELADDAPADLVSVAGKAMARDPAARYSAAELVADLRSFQRGQLVGVHDYTVRELVRRWIGRHKALVLTSVVLTLLGAAATGWFVAQTQREKDRTAAQLRDAMMRSWERGRRELEIGNRREAIRALSTAYHHIRDPLLARHLGEALRGTRGFIRELERFDEPVGGLAMRGDGKRVIAIAGGRVHLLDDEGNTLLEAAGSTASFLDGGRKILAIERSGLMSVWDSETAAPVGSVHVGFSESGPVASAPGIVAVADRQTLRVFQTDPLQLLYEIPSGIGIVGPLSFSADGSRLLSAGLHKSIFDRRGEVLMRTDFTPTRAGALSPDGTQYITSNATGLGVFNDRGEQIGEIPSVDVSSASYSADGTRVLFRDGLFAICVWSFTTRKRRCVNEDSLATVGVTPNFERVAVARDNGDVVVRDDEGRVRMIVAASDLDMPQIRLTDDGRRMVTGGDDGAVRLWNIDFDSVDARIPHPAGRRSAHIEGNLLLIGAPERLQIWDLDNSDRPLVELAGRPEMGVNATHGGSVVAWAGKTWDLKTGEPIAELAGWKRLMVPVVDPSGRVVVARDDGGMIRALDARTGERLWSASLADLLPDLSMKESSIPAFILFGPAGQLVVQSLSADLVLDRDSGRPIRTIARPFAVAAHTSVFYGQGKYATSSDDRVYLTDLDSGETHAVASAGNGLSVSHDGRYLLIPREASVVVYDTQTDTRVKAIPYGSRLQAGTAFSRDGTVLALTRGGGWVDLFELPGGRWIGERFAGDSAYKISFTETGRLAALSREETRIFDLPVETRSPRQVDVEVARVLGRRP